jgi:hypothetical protein
MVCGRWREIVFSTPRLWEPAKYYGTQSKILILTVYGKVGGRGEEKTVITRQVQNLGVLPPRQLLN